MVLDHVADRARLFIVTAAPFHAERFRDGDLHMIDVSVIPKRLQQNVGEAQRHEILNRFLAEIMVDAENIALAERRADHIVDRRGALAVPADRLLNDDARARGCELLGAKPLRQRAEQVRAGREIIGANAFIRAEQRLQIRPSAVVHGVDRDIVETGQKSLRRRARLVVNSVEFYQRVFDRGAERVAFEVTARSPDYSGRVGELIAAFAVKERRIELTIGQIAGAAKNDEIERLNLDDARGHNASLVCRGAKWWSLAVVHSSPAI